MSVSALTQTARGTAEGPARGGPAAPNNPAKETQ